MFEQVFLYCERGTASAALAEPLNAVSNLAFALAALVIWRRTSAAALEPDRRSAMRLVAWLGMAIAIGSFAFHVSAVRLAQIGDVVPIGIAVLVLLHLALTWVCGFSRQRSMTVTAAVGGLAAATGGRSTSLGCSVPSAVGGALQALPPSCLNGSWPYVPVLVALGAVAAHATWRGCRGGGRLAAASATFALALAARSLDLPFCGDAPAILHAVWHVGAAATLYLTATALLDGRRKERPLYA